MQRCEQIYKPFHVGNDAASHLDGHVPYGSSSHDMISYLGLIRLWLACAVESFSKGFAPLWAAEQINLQDAADILSGKTRAPALIPESARAPEAPTILLNRSAKRILARGLPASRRYGWFRYASSHTLNGNQFFELLGRFSVIGRAVVYRLEYKARLCTRRSASQNLKNQRPCPTIMVHLSVNLGYCANHLWPD